MGMTEQQLRALEALESMDDFARMDTGVDPIGPYKVLREFIESPIAPPANKCQCSASRTLIGYGCAHCDPRYAAAPIPPASEQRLVGKVIGRNFGCMPRVEWYDSFPEAGSLLYAAQIPKMDRDEIDAAIASVKGGA